MSPDALNDHVINIERSFAATPDAVFAAWTERDQIVQWYGPDGYTVPECEMDVRVGGGIRICMMEPDGTPHWVDGKYLEITPPEVLSFTWAWEMEDEVGPESIVRIEFVAEDGGTRLVVSHTGFDSAESRDGHNQGWVSSFDSLERHLS